MANISGFSNVIGLNVPAPGDVVTGPWPFGPIEGYENGDGFFVAFATNPAANMAGIAFVKVQASETEDFSVIEAEASNEAGNEFNASQNGLEVAIAGLTPAAAYYFRAYVVFQ